MQLLPNKFFYFFALSVFFSFMATILAHGEAVIIVVLLVVANNHPEESCTREQHRGFVLAQILVQAWKELASE